jgi:glucan exporter ATP-binding protein
LPLPRLPDKPFARAGAPPAATESIMAFVRLYLRVLAQLGPARNLGAILALANLALAVAQFSEPMLFGRIVDHLAVAQRQGRAIAWNEITPLLGAWAGFGLFTIAAGVLVALNADRLAHRRRLASMAQFFEHVLHLPLSFHAGAHSGRLLKVMLEGSNGLAGLWLSFFRENCASLVALTVLLPLSLIVNVRLAAILVALVVAFGLTMTFVLRRTEALQGEVERAQSDVAQRTSDALGNVPVIQSFARIKEETGALRRLNEQLLASQIPVLSWWAVASVATRASSTLTLLTIFVVGVWLDMHGEATIGQIVAFMSLAGMLIARLEQIVGFVNYMFMQAPKLAQFFEVLDARSEIIDRPGGRAIGRARGEVTFENVSFSYDGRRDAVRDLNIRIAPGQVVALVGATGSGKSTTLGLLHRVFDPGEGRVLIDGVDVRDIRLDSLRENIGVVFQEPFLFARSIEENLRIGKPGASASEIAAALEQAQASGFVAALPEGLASNAGERGRALSGGERQRIAIARALLKNPAIMILDEATSALDATTERQVQAALYAATRGRTTFVIAHRLATVRNADRILVFDQGRIAEEGSFHGLIAKDGLFAKLARAQFLTTANVGE